MKNSLTIKDLLDKKTRLLIYLISFTSLIFLQTFCVNICPFIDGLGLIKKNGVWKVKLASILWLFKKDYLQMSVKKQ